MRTVPPPPSGVGGGGVRGDGILKLTSLAHPFGWPPGSARRAAAALFKKGGRRGGAPAWDFWHVAYFVLGGKRVLRANKN